MMILKSLVCSLSNLSLSISSNSHKLFTDVSDDLSCVTWTLQPGAINTDMFFFPKVRNIGLGAIYLFLFFSFLKTLPEVLVGMLLKNQTSAQIYSWITDWEDGTGFAMVSINKNTLRQCKKNSGRRAKITHSASRREHRSWAAGICLMKRALWHYFTVKSIKLCQPDRLQGAQVFSPSVHCDHWHHSPQRWAYI